MDMTKPQPPTLEESLGLPKGVRMRKFLGFYLIRPKHFRKVVAQQAGGLTHELCVTKVNAGFYDGRDTRYTNAAWLELDKQMRLFVQGILGEK